MISKVPYKEEEPKNSFKKAEKAEKQGKTEKKEYKTPALKVGMFF